MYRLSLKDNTFISNNQYCSTLTLFILNIIDFLDKMCNISNNKTYEIIIIPAQYCY